MLTFDELAAGLARYGVPVPGLDHVRALLDANVNAAEPPSLFYMRPDEYAAHIRARTVDKLVSSPRHGDVLDVARHIHAALWAEYFAELRPQADDLVKGLRPAFDEAADAARALRALGVHPAATMGDLFDADDATRQAWRTFGRVHTATLDEILAIRQALSAHLRIPPSATRARGAGFPAVDPSWSLVVTRPGVPGVDPGPLPLRDTTAPWSRWLTLAPALHLATLDELDPATIAAAEGLPVAQLLAEARRRLEAGYGEPETTAHASASVDLSGAYLARYPEPQPQPAPAQDADPLDLDDVDPDARRDPFTGELFA